MRAFLVSNQALWSFVITCHLILGGNAGRLVYKAKEDPIAIPSATVHKKLKENDIEISNSSNAECKLSADSSTSHKVCLTPACTKAAKEILLSINKNVDPCDNFPRFACGGWIDRHTIPDKQDIIEVLSAVRDRNWRELKVLMDKKLTGAEPEHVQIIKNMYDSCMDIEAIRASGLRPLEEFFEVLGGWPVLEGVEWKGNHLDWIDMLALARQQGYGYSDFLIKNTVFEGSIIFLEMTGRVYKNGTEDPKAVSNLEKMVKMAEKLGREPSLARKEMLDVINFEISLGNFTFPENSTITEVTFRKLMNMVPQIKWRKYIKKYLLGYPIPQNSRIEAHIPYLIHFAEVMNNTEKRVLNNYILWRIAEEYSTAFLERQEDRRWKHCLKILKTSFGDALDSYYVKNYFDEEIKEKIQELITIQQKELLDVLENNTWLHEDTKKLVTAKVNALESVIGYPNRIFNDTAVSNKYTDIGITNGSFIDNYLKLRKVLVKQEIFKDFRKQTRFTVDHEGRHLPKNFTINIAPELLQNPIFNKDRPHYINFGSMGFQVGHGIQVGIIPSYRFPENYSLVDKNGNLTESEEKRKCFKEQYQNYTLEDGFELKNMNILKEEDDEKQKILKEYFNYESRENLIRNMADSEGLKIAYKAYNSWVTKYGSEAQLPGLKYTPKQLFWISFASNLCAKSRPEYNARLDAHIFSPWEYRVAGSIANQPDFANDFQCQEGSNMNPKTKCQLW